jgi:nucleotide-binding universal stress UspA family protein
MAQLRNVLYLTNFSSASENVIPAVRALHRGYYAKVHALHVILTGMHAEEEEASRAEKNAQQEIQRVSSLLAGIDYEIVLERAGDLWTVVERLIEDRQIGLLVLGIASAVRSGGATLGSNCDEIFRRSPVHVLTVGPSGAKEADGEYNFRRILFATDFTPDAISAVACAISFSRWFGASLILTHVMPQPEPGKRPGHLSMSVAEVMHHLHETIPSDAGLPFRPKAVVEFGEPSEQILKAAKAHGADLIVLGMRPSPGKANEPSQAGRNIARRVVTASSVPVLTVRTSAAASSGFQSAPH